MIPSLLRVLWAPPVPGWELARHPESPHPVATAPPAAQPAHAGGGGYGVLDLRVGGLFSGGVGTGAPRPQAPVVLIGSRPVTQGWGRAWITLPAGEHVLEVQAGRSRLTRVVRVPDGGTLELDYLHCAPWRFDPGEKHTALGPRGTVRLAPKLRQTASWTAVAVFAVAAVAAAYVNGAPALRVALAVGLPLAVLAAGFVHAARVRAGLRAAPAPVPVPALGTTPVLLAPDGPVPEPPPGTGAVVIDAAFVTSPNSRDRLRELLDGGADDVRGLTRAYLRLGEPLPLPHRPWAGPFLLGVDGREAALPWGRWLLPLAPGTYELRFAVSPPSPALTGPRTAVDTGDARTATTVTIEAGRVVHVPYAVVLTMAAEAERPELARFGALAVDRIPAADT